MFHYRLTPSNNRSRILIAAFLAIVVHIGLMNFEFDPEPVFVPSVSLPRSVSIFLRQSSIVQPPVQPVGKTQNSNPVKEEHIIAEKEPEMPVLQKAPAEIIESESSFQPPTILEKKVEQPAAIEEEKSRPASEEINPADQKAENIPEDLKPEDGRTAKVQEFATQAQKGVHLPGTIQVAYPRYQLNSPPAYPYLARKRAQEGTVILQVLVKRDGRVGDLEIDVSSNFTLLDRAAKTAVQKWSFEPGRRGEERVPMWVRVPVTFKLNE